MTPPPLPSPTSPNSPGNAPRKRHLWWLRILLVLITVAAYAPLRTADFTNWDDPQTIYENPHLRPPSAEHIAWFWTHPYMDIYAPLTFSLWGLLMNVGKLSTPDAMGRMLNPWVFHTTNVLLHLCALLAAFELLRRLTKHAGAAAMGALLFALHPVQVEPVAWVSGLKDVLYGLFSLIALWQYVEYVQQASTDKSLDAAIAPTAHAAAAPAKQAIPAVTLRPALHYSIALIALLLALFSKPTAVVTPLLAGVIDWLLLRRNWKQALISLWPWFVLAMGFAVIAKLSQPTSTLTMWPLWSRPVVAADALAFYLYKLLYPVSLAVHYGRNPTALLRTTQWYWTWLAPAAAAVGIILLRKRIRWLAAGGLLGLVCLLPVLGLTPFDFQFYSTVADHYLYLAMIGPALIAAALLARWWKPLPIALSCTALTLLGIRTFTQAAYWDNTVAIFTHTLAVNPHSGIAHERLALYYTARGVARSRAMGDDERSASQLLRQGRAHEAQASTREAERYHAFAMDDWRTAQQQFLLALKENPLWPRLLLNLAVVMANQRHFDQAMEQLRIIIRTQPSLPPVLRKTYETHWFNLGADAYDGQDYQQAIDYFGKALQDQPGDDVSLRALQIAQLKMRAVAATHPTNRKSTDNPH